MTTREKVSQSAHPHAQQFERVKTLCVAVVDARGTVRSVCGEVIRSLGYHAVETASADQALEFLRQQPVDIVIAGIHEALGDAGLLDELQRSYPRTELAIITAAGALRKAVEALKLGASEYIIEPFSTEEVRILVQRLAQTLQLKDENVYLRSRLQSRERLGQMVGQSAEMQKVFRVIQKAAQSRFPVLILGESGTGKELVARSIHESGPWSNRPFVPVDCGALAPTLIESELFGHVRGAFTGAAHNKEGLLEAARDGTLFLDEIGELSMELQTRLLRSIQEKEFRPVGGTRSVAFGGRIVAATNRNLKAGIGQGVFRKELYYRLNVLAITLPALRDRRSDVPLLADHILRKLSRSEAGVRAKAPWVLSSAALDRLLTYHWPGNVRELENCLERAVTMSSGPLIQMKDLPSTLQLPSLQAPDTPTAVIPLEDMERQAIERALASTGGDKMLAARLLGIGKTTLYRKLGKYRTTGLEKD